MAKSDLTKLEISGVLRKMHIFNSLDIETGLIEGKTDSIRKSHRVGLNTFASGGYNEKFGIDMMNKIVGGNGIIAVSATRGLDFAIFTIDIKSVFDDRTLQIKYPHGGYK